MRSSFFKGFKVVVTMVLAACIAASVIGHVWYAPGIVILVAAAVLLIMKRRVRDVTEDERDRKVAGRAALMAMMIYSIASAVVGTTLVAYDGGSAILYAVGSAILYSASAFMVLYSILFQFYVRRQDQD